MLYLGVDLGGTNIAIGLVDEAGAILHQDSCPTGANRPFADIISDMGALALRVVAESGHTMEEVSSVGIGSPGAADLKSGVVIFANNLNWRNVDVRGELSKYLDQPIYVDNDANVAALAELYAGVAQGKDSVILLTLGTGVGGGIVLNRRVWGGRHNVGGEIGHMIVETADGEPCSCGNDGCWERYTSATALIREGRKAVVEYPGSLIYAMTGGDPDKVTAKVVLDAAKQGDFNGERIFRRFIHYLALGIVSLINILDPDVIALGGGVSKAGDFLLSALLPEVREHIFYKDLPSAEILLSQLGNDAGIIGAAMMARQMVEDA